MNNATRNLGFYLGAIGVHAAVLWGWSYSGPTLISEAGSEGDSVEVSLVEGVPGASGPETTGSEPPAPEPPKPEPPAPEPPKPEPPAPEPPKPEPPAPEPPKPEPPAPEPPKPEPPAPEPPKPEPPAPEPPKPEPPAPKPEPRKVKSAPVAAKPLPDKSVGSAVKSAGSRSAGTATSSQGAPGAGRGGGGAGDNAHATWRNKVQPVYPEAARMARLAGRLEIEVRVNALGQPVGARVVKSSGSSLLDASALKAVRASTFNPKRLGSIPLPDTIIVPVTFRLNTES
jgi:TonB family protein